MKVVTRSGLTAGWNFRSEGNYANKHLIRKHGGNKLLRRPRCRWPSNFKIISRKLTEKGSASGSCKQINSWLHTAKNFLTTCETVSMSRIIPLLRVTKCMVSREKLIHFRLVFINVYKTVLKCFLFQSTAASVRGSLYDKQSFKQRRAVQAQNAVSHKL